MGNALQKAPIGNNKHSVLNNSQTSEATGDRSLLNTTAEGDSAGTPLVINDPRSPTDGISRTPIQISRTKSLFRGMFSGRRPTQADANECAAASGNLMPGSFEELHNGTSKNGDANHDVDKMVSVTTSSNSPNVKTSNGTPLSEGNGAYKNGDLKNGHVNGKAEADNSSPEVKADSKPTIVEEPVDTPNTTGVADTTTENEEAFIVVDNKKKKKKREKAEAKAKEDTKTKLIEQFDRLAPANGKALTKVQSDSKLAYSNSDVESSPTEEPAVNYDSAKHRLSNANENDMPSSAKGFRTKVEKACRSLTNLTSAKSKAITVNGKANGKASHDEPDIVDSAECTGTSAPENTSDVCSGEVLEPENIANGVNGSGKYQVLVNDE